MDGNEVEVSSARFHPILEPAERPVT